MADSKTYTIGFNLLDNFSAKYNDLQKKLASITDTTHDIKFDVDNGIISKTDEIGKKVGESASGISKSINKVSDSNKELEQTTKKAADASKNQVSAVNQLKSGYENLSDTLGKLKTVAAGVFAILGSGIVGGMSWKGAYESSMFSTQAYEIMANNKRIDLEKIKEFSKQAKFSGYTSSTDRLSMAYSMTMRGAKNTNQAIGATEGIEKTFLKYDELLTRQYGITTAEQLAEVATKRTVGRFDKQMLDDIFGKGFSNKSQTSRVKALGGVGEGIDAKKELSEDPLYEIQVRIKSITKSIGTELLGVFKPLTENFAKFLSLIDKNPILPKILAISVGFITIAGILLTIVGVLPLLSAGIKSVSAGMTMLSNAGNIMKLSSLLLSPYGILIAIGAILLIVAYKTGVLSAAWDKFTKSAIGGDILSSIQAIGEVIGMVVDRFSEWYEASGRSQLLTYFGFLVEVLGNAYDIVDKIYSKTKSATGNPLLAGLAALASMPVALYAGGIQSGVKAATGVDVVDILGGMHDRLTQIYRSISSTLSSTMEKGAVLLGKLLSVFEMIVNPIIKLFDMIRDIFGKFFGGEETTPLSNPEREDMVSWAKNLRKAGGSKMFDFGLNTDIWDIALKEAETGIAQDVPNMQDGGAEYRRLVNSYRNRIANPSEGLGDVAPVEGAAGNPFYNPAFTNSIKGPGGIEVRTKPSEEITSSADVEGLLQIGGRMVWDRLFGGTKEAATGGDITSGGRINLHKGETVVPADIARSSYLVNLLRNVSEGGSSAGSEIHVHNDNKFDFSGAKLSPDFDMTKLMREIDSRIEAGSTKAILSALGQRRT